MRLRLGGRRTAHAALPRPLAAAARAGQRPAGCAVRGSGGRVCVCRAGGGCILGINDCPPATQMYHWNHLRRIEQHYHDMAKLR